MGELKTNSYFELEIFDLCLWNTMKYCKAHQVLSCSKTYEEDIGLALEIYLEQNLKQTITHPTLPVLLLYFWSSNNICSPSVCACNDAKIAQFG
jgi:hypothetical protein